MRISNRAAARQLLYHVQEASNRLNETQERVASGKRVNKASDDPFAASRILTARTQRDVIQQRMRTIDIAHAELGVVESSLEALHRVLTRAQELAVQADSAAVDASARAQIAAEVSELISEAITIANTSSGGRRIFGGHQTGTPPFAPDVPGHPTAVTYSGDSGQILREIGDGERIAVNLDGDLLFGGVFTSLIEFRDALLANDRPAINTAAIAIGAELETSLQARGDVGARMRRIELTWERLEAEDARLQQFIAGLEEVDLTAEVVELQMRDTAFQAALSATARSMGVSLLDFLR